MRTKNDDLTGRIFGRWRILGPGPLVKGTRFWACVCTCGEERLVHHYNLVRKKTKSCGCYQREDTSRRRRTHGRSGHPLYSQWQAMRARCLYPHHRDYRFYGARGIMVCEEWKEFDGFLRDMEAGWRKGLTIERVDVDGDYEPSNVRWATQAEQARNTRRTIFLDSPWGTLPASDCARRLGIGVSVFLARYHRGWPPERLYSARKFTRWDKEGVSR
jgi:hypothetical protein